MNNRAHLRAKNAQCCGALQNAVQIWHRFEQLHVFGCVLQALVDLQKWHNATLLPQILRRRLPLEIPIHRIFKENRADHFTACEVRRAHNSAAHRVDHIKHFGITGEGFRINPIGGQSFGGRATALIQSGNKALAGPN